MDIGTNWPGPASATNFNYYGPFLRLYAEPQRPEHGRASRFLRLVWDHFLYHLCPEAATNTPATAPVLGEEDIRDIYMKEALRHADHASSIWKWLKELEDPKPGLMLPPGIQHEGANTSTPVPSPEADSALDSREDVVVVPGGEMLEKLMEISATYGTSSACTQLVALNKAMEIDHLKGPDGPKAAEAAYDALRGRRASLLLSLASLAQKESPSEDVMKARLSRIISAISVLKDIELGKTGPGPWQDPIFHRKLLNKKALLSEAGLDKAQERFAVAYSQALDAVRDLSVSINEYCATTERVSLIGPLETVVKRERDNQDNRPGPSRRRRLNPQGER